MAFRTETLDRSRGGMWPWLGQRVTAVLVIVTIMVHLVLTHYIAIGELSFDNIGDRLAGGAVLVNDIVLLVAVVYHALNGLRMVVLDWGLAEQRRAARLRRRAVARRHRWPSSTASGPSGSG